MPLIFWPSRLAPPSVTEKLTVLLLPATSLTRRTLLRPTNWLATGTTLPPPAWVVKL